MLHRATEQQQYYVQRILMTYTSSDYHSIWHKHDIMYSNKIVIILLEPDSIQRSIISCLNYKYSVVCTQLAIIIITIMIVIERLGDVLYGHSVQMPQL